MFLLALTLLNLQENSCNLCIEEDYRVVSKCYIVVIDSTVIHGVLLAHDTYKVVMKTVVEPDAHLPIPIDDEFVFVKDAINIMVAWPQYLILKPNEKVKYLLIYETEVIFAET